MIIIHFLILFQHESLSVQMFKHLVERNNLDGDFKEYFKEDLPTEKKFIMELIERPSEVEGQVHEHEFFF